MDTRIPRERMSPIARKYRDAYARVPRAPFVQKTFGLWMALDAWRADGLPDVDLDEFFQYDPPGKVHLGGLGWCEAAFHPAFETKCLEDRGDYELVQDGAGRGVLYFKGRRDGFMPEYVTHPVTGFPTWERDVKWRLSPSAPGRLEALEAALPEARKGAAEGQMVTQTCIGGYMYLRSLIGPEALLYAFHDQPDLIHACMRQWLELAEFVCEFHQREFTLDEFYIGEDICYNHGPLISPAMIREFLFPYYGELIQDIRKRQRDKSRHLYIQLDTDGDARPVIPLYRELGFDVFSPFEVASGCDVVAIAKQYPGLVLQGGFDKRILAAGRDAIDREVDRIFPVLYERGGYIPTCDHGVPAEVDWRDYLHFRKRCLEFNR
ncbi:MAG: uroporphyrinogen decarboxylase family protein [Kiritimatiellia bacterium]|jgi:uroporphyrinogen-III decarboxylase